jgi:hypothetical protein
MAFHEEGRRAARVRMVAVAAAAAMVAGGGGISKIVEQPGKPLIDAEGTERSEITPRMLEVKVDLQRLHPGLYLFGIYARPAGVGRITLWC